MITISSVLEKLLGTNNSEQLIKLYALIQNSGGTPLTIYFDDGEVLEIQYLKKIDDINNYDQLKHWFDFGVNYDGFNLILDFSRIDVPLMQDEFGEVDELGFTLKDLIVTLSNN